MRRCSIFGWLARACGLVVLLGGQMVFTAPSAHAATFNVTNGNDAGAGSLRQAFIDATNTAGDDTVVVDDAVNMITLTTGLVLHAPADNAALTLQGNGVTIQQNTANAGVIASASSGTLTVDAATIRGGNGALGFSGAGVSSGGPVVLTNTTVTNNAVTNSTGGGIGSNGNVTITNSTVSMNTASGVGGGIVATGAVSLINSSVNNNDGGGTGGIFATGTLTITNSTVSGNDGTVTSGVSVGGASMNSGTAGVTLTNSTVSGNTAGTNGGLAAGGLGSGGGPITIVGSTIATNSVTGSPSDAAGGVGSLGGDVTATNSTVTGNATATGSGADAGGIGANDVTLKHATVVNNTGTDAGNVSALDSADPGSLTTFGSVIADPGSPNCVLGTGGTSSTGYNFADDTSCGLGHATDNQNAANNPMLGALANNGGPTQTRLPQHGSPLVDAIPNASCDGSITTDQRGQPRPGTAGSNCDIGAVEGSSPPLPPPSTSPPVCPANQASLGAGSLIGAEGVVVTAPLGIYVLWRRRRGLRSGPTARIRLRSALTWLSVAGLAVAVLAACAPVKSPAPPGC